MTRSAFLSSLILSLSAFQGMTAGDPVVMTIGAEKVKRSVFEYYYRKNATSMEKTLSPREYLPLFGLFRMKVADAKAAGLDTIPAFVKEMSAFREELAQPYLVDSAYLESFVTEQAERSLKDVEAAHIMIFKKSGTDADAAARERIDSILHCVRDGEDFNVLASRFSEDKMSAARGGSLGFITAGRYPYSFESAVYSLPQGGVSEIIATPAGYHIVKAGARRPASGKVRASHILKFVAKDAPAERESEAKREIDSLFNIVNANKAVFADMARAASDDTGSASLGGDLSWFSRGDMVPEFEETVYSLADGEISEPVKSPFGWHIIMRTGSRPAPGADELRESVMRRIGDPRDPRHKLVRLHDLERLAAKHSVSIDSTAIAGMIRLIENGYNPDFVAVDSILCQLRRVETDWLYDNVADYRNLLDEYRDGSLLYEISAKKIWSRTSVNDDGSLEKDWERDMRKRYKVMVNEKEFGKIK